MSEKDYTTIVGELLMNKFNLRIRTTKMYYSDEIYCQIPALYFRLIEDERTERDYLLIKKAVETFEGNLKWRFGRSYPSRINYEIIPKLAQELKEQNPGKGFQKIMSTKQYEELCELAIADIPELYQHMKNYIENYKI